MKILHIMAVCRGLGGAETYAVDVMLSLHKAGIDQCVVMSRRAPRFAELQAAGVRMAPQVLVIPFRFLQKYLLRRLLDCEQPDIVHCWMRRAASLMPKQTSGKTKTVIGWFGGYYNPKHFKSCSHFVGVTQDIVAHMAREGVPAERAFYIPTFPDIADMPPIDRASLNTPKDAKVLLTLSRLHEKKGLDTFLKALTGLPDCIGWIAGEGPLRRELEELAQNLDVQKRVRFLGWRTDRAALLRAADVCVLPSRYEPFGTVILEAWAAKTPLVAASSAGPAAHIQDGVNGLLVPIDDMPALAQAMRRALDDKGLREHMTAEGYTAYTRDFTRDAVTQKWVEFYQARMSGAA